MSRTSFVERRQIQANERSVAKERRQFADNRDRLAPEVRELADAIDHYKLEHHRRFIDHEELLAVLLALGYSKQPSADASEEALAALAMEVGRDKPHEALQAAVGNHGR